jgi:hypothetical protein
MKTALFWYAALCSLVETDYISEVLTACSIRVMKAAGTSETSVSFCRLHGATSQKTVIFKLVAVRTLNLTKNR